MRVKSSFNKSLFQVKAHGHRTVEYGSVRYITRTVQCGQYADAIREKAAPVPYGNVPRTRYRTVRYGTVPYCTGTVSYSHLPLGLPSCEAFTVPYGTVKDDFLALGAQFASAELVLFFF
jgi:hypothetical protein